MEAIWLQRVAAKNLGKEVFHGFGRLLIQREWDGWLWFVGATAEQRVSFMADQESSVMALDPHGGQTPSLPSACVDADSVISDFMSFKRRVPVDHREIVVPVVNFHELVADPQKDRLPLIFQRNDGMNSGVNA